MTFVERPSTPDHVKPFRGPYQQDPGRTFKHFGTARDPEPQGPFGRDTRPDPAEGVQNVMKQGPEGELERWKYEQAERVYASRRREPLGERFTRGHVLPEGLGTETPFGVPANALALQAMGQVRQAMEGMGGEETDEARALYRRTHAHFAPGEQRKRGYDWGDRDPRAEVFGRPTPVHDEAEIARILSHADGAGVTVVPATLADFRAARADELGRVRTCGFGDRAVSAEAAGIPSSRFDDAGVEALLKGIGGTGDVRPDADLGRSLRPGYRNVPRDGDDGRSFGVPSVRTDLPAPRSVSVANATNFGNEPDAASLVFPSAGAERGVGDQVMSRAVDADEIRGLVAAAGVEMDDETVAEVFARAATDGKCRLTQFLRAKAALERERAGL